MYVYKFFFNVGMVVIKLFTFRSLYKQYAQLYKKHLLEGYNSELEADLMKLEDELNLTNIVLARMHAKIKVWPVYSIWKY